MAKLKETTTKVPISGGQSVRLTPGSPWPSAYRGSEYSVVSHDDFTDAVLKWEQRDLSVYTSVPNGLQRALSLLGKSGGYGSIRLTAGKEVLAKVPAEEYDDVNKAPIDSGWIPVYVGKLDGTIEFDEIDTDPRAPRQNRVKVWRGFPFNHGERWSVSYDGNLIWTWRDYRFKPAFDHSELVSAYQEYRETAGRLYCTENGHIWINVPNDDIAPAKGDAIQSAVKKWRGQAEESGNTSTLRLVNRRLVATSGGDDPSTGHLPIHLGQLRDFDNGRIPRPIVEDESYFQAVCDYETVWE